MVEKIWRLTKFSRYDISHQILLHDSISPTVRDSGTLQA